MSEGNEHPTRPRKDIRSSREIAAEIAQESDPQKRRVLIDELLNALERETQAADIGPRDRRTGKGGSVGGTKEGREGPVLTIEMCRMLRSISIATRAPAR